MSYAQTPFIFSPNFDFATDSVFTVTYSNMNTPFPPTAGNFELLDGTPFLLLDGTNFLLL